MKTRWKALTGLIATCVALIPAAGAQAASQAEIDQAVSAGGQWLASQQADSGAISGFNGDWAVGTVAAAGLHAAELRTAPENPSLQDYWQDRYSASSWGSLPNANGSAQLGKAVLIAHSAGIQPTRVAVDVNLAAGLASIHDWETGLFGAAASPNTVGFALLALPHLGFPDSVAAPIVQSLLGSQHDDGGWTFSAGGGSTPGDTDLTGAVLAMICSNGMGPGDEAVDRGLGFLKANQDEATGAIFASGPWVPEFNGPTLGWALIGINACEQDPQGPEWTTGEGVNVVDAALSLQLAGGEFQFTPTSGAEHPNNVSATEAVARALSGNLFSADPPAPADPSVPRWRPAPEVPVGTTVPVAIAIEDGEGPTRLCAVELPSGVSIRAALDIARLQSVPAGCIEQLTWSGGDLESVNGSSAPHENGGWLVSVAGAQEQPVASQPVGFGDVVSLRLVAGSPAPDPETKPELEPEPEADSPPAQPGGEERPQVEAKPRMRVARQSRRPADNRVAAVAAIGCPASAGPCRVAAGPLVRLRIRGGDRPGAGLARVLAPRRMAPGTRALIRVRVSRRAMLRLRGARAVGSIPVRLVNQNGAKMGRIPVRLRG